MTKPTPTARSVKRKTAIQTAVITAVVMSVYEFSKELIFQGKLSPWESHLITIGFTSVMAATVITFIQQSVLLRERQLRLKAQASEEKFRSIADNIPDFVARLDIEGRTLFVNPALLEQLGCRPEDLLGKTIIEGRPHESSYRLAQAHQQVLDTGEPHDFDFTFTAPDGATYQHLLRIVPEKDAEGQIISVLSVGRDVTELRSLIQEQQQASIVFQHATEGILVTDSTGTIVSVNPAFCDITGYSPAEAIGRKPSFLQSDRHDKIFYASLWHSIINEGEWQGDIWNRRKDGEAFLEWLTINRVQNELGETIRYVGVFRDITEMRKQDEHLRHMAFHDALTGLPNRTLFDERLSHALKRHQRQNASLAVMFIDLDGFKAINDTYGHDVGDCLLQQIAERINGCLKRDTDTTARIGGDEFLVLIEDLTSPAQCHELAQQLLLKLNQPLSIRHQQLNVGASIGIALFPEHGKTAEELISCADKSMYAVKRQGKGTYLFSSNDSNQLPTKDNC